MTSAGRLLGVDFGTVRVGLAISDPDRLIASPLETYTRRGTDNDAAFFANLVKEERVAELLVGLPIHLSGEEGRKAAEARRYGAWLQAVCGLPVTYWDERYTTVMAEDAMLEAGLTKKRRQSRRDRVAAQFLLQSYLDAQSS